MGKKTFTHPIIKLLDKQADLGIALVMDSKKHSSATILKLLAEVLDDGELNSKELQDLCIELHSRVKLV